MRYVRKCAIKGYYKIRINNKLFHDAAYSHAFWYISPTRAKKAGMGSSAGLTDKFWDHGHETGPWFYWRFYAIWDGNESSKMNITIFFLIELYTFLSRYYRGFSDRITNFDWRQEINPCNEILQEAAIQEISKIKGHMTLLERIQSLSHIMRRDFLLLVESTFERAYFIFSMGKINFRKILRRFLEKIQMIGWER